MLQSVRIWKFAIKSNKQKRSTRFWMFRKLFVIWKYFGYSFKEVKILLKFALIPTEIFNGNKSFLSLKSLKNCFNSSKIQYWHSSAANMLTLLSMKLLILALMNSQDSLICQSKFLKWYWIRSTSSMKDFNNLLRCQYLKRSQQCFLIVLHVSEDSRWTAHARSLLQFPGRLWSSLCSWRKFQDSYLYH